MSRYSIQLSFFFVSLLVTVAAFVQFFPFNGNESNELNSTGTATNARGIYTFTIVPISNDLEIEMETQKEQWF